MKEKEVLILEIVRLNNEGEGVGLHDGFVVFVKGALIDEKVMVEVEEVFKNYSRAKLLKVLSTSKERVIPICPNYKLCGGCNIMHMSNSMQLEFKKNKIESVFNKICKLDIDIGEIYSCNSLYYRNKAILRIEGNKIGYYISKTNTLVDIDECFICDKLINDVIKVIKDFINHYKTHKIKEVMIRVAKEEVMVSFKGLNKRWYETIIERLKFVTCIYVDNELIYGVESINQKINDLVFDISPKSFFQVNIETITKLYTYALRKINDQNVCADLYSGTGTITMLLAKKARRVIGIEVNEAAVNDAKNNLLLNNIDNVEFKLGKVEELIRELRELNIDTMVLDPPRGGSDRKSLRSILKIKPKHLVYISCNPISLARDFNILRSLYDIEEIKGFDMFPNTSHVETVMILEKKDV